MPTLDYLAGTYLTRSSGEVMADFAGVVDGFQEGRGHHGYKACLRAEGVSIYYDGSEGMGVHCQVSSRGCGLLEETERYCGCGAAIRSFMSLGFRATRSDVAIDERKGKATAEMFLAACRADEVVSKWEDYSYHGGAKRGIDSGLTVYLGDKTSECYLCCYDKRAERIGAGCADPGVWTRFELRYKGRAAEAIVLRVALCDDLFWAYGLLNDCCQVRRRSTADCNRSRWPVRGWWNAVVNGADREPLYVFRPALELDVQIEHFERSYGQRLVVLEEASRLAGRSPFLCEDILQRGRRNISAKSRIRISGLVKAQARADCQQAGINSETGEVV